MAARGCAILHQPLGDGGRGGIVGAGAVEDDLAIARQVAQPDEDLRVVDRQRSGNEARIETAGGRRAHVDHYRVLVLAHELAQFIDGDARHAKHPVEATPLPPFEGDVRSEERHDDRDRGEPVVLQPPQELADLRVEDHPGADRARPWTMRRR